MIEIQHRDSPYVYRIDPKDARNVLRRENKHAARWYFYLRRDTPQEAKRALFRAPVLQLQAGDDE